MPNLGKCSSKKCVSGSTHLNWNILGLRGDLSWRKGCGIISVAEKDPICKALLSCEEKMWYQRQIIWKMGSSPQTVQWYTIFQGFAKLKGRHANKNSFSSQHETNYTSIVFKANGFCFPLSSELARCGGHCLSQSLPSNAPNFWPKQPCARQFEICLCASELWHCIRQFVWYNTLVPLSNSIKLRN